MGIELRMRWLGWRGRTFFVGAALTAVALVPASVRAQGVRGWVGTTVQTVDLRPLTLDSIPLFQAVMGPDGTYTYLGQPVTCEAADLCTFYRPLPKERATVATQDVSLTAWGFGIQGLSVTTLLRGRARSGTDLLWPRSDDDFDIMVGYAQLVRGDVRLRVGRQELRSGLGFSAFDGGAASVDLGAFSMEAYGGRSLARGLREPTNEALSSLESFIPDESVYLFGGAAYGRVSSTTFTARYQREILSDRSSLVSERASFDFVSTLPGARISGAVDYDFAFQRVGKSRLTVARPLAGGRGLVEGSVRRYVPYFQLSTIWGFFEPVSYTEAELRTAWSATGFLGLWVSGGWRKYGDSRATVVFRPLRDDGWRASAGMRAEMREGLSMDGSYRLEWGPGSFLSSGDLALRYQALDRLSLAAHGTTFQQIEEFRLGDGRAYGGGISFDLRLLGRATLSGGGTVLKHRDGGSVFSSPWNQSRAWSALRIDVGGDPGLAQRRNRS
jgi:hypothetical protein